MNKNAITVFSRMLKIVAQINVCTGRYWPCFNSGVRRTINIVCILFTVVNIYIKTWNSTIATIQ